MLCIVLLRPKRDRLHRCRAGGIGSFFVPLIFIFIIMYFVMIWPQKKRQEQRQKLIGSLKSGERVITNAVSSLTRIRPEKSAIHCR